MEGISIRTERQYQLDVPENIKLHIIMVVIYVYLEGENEITLTFHMNNSFYGEINTSL